MTGKLEDNIKLAAIILSVAIMIFLLVRGCITGDMSFLDSGDDWVDRAASHGKHWDAR